MASNAEGPTNTRSKEAGGQLMSIIRTLASSSDLLEREKEKARLEKAYKESDRALDKLLAEHLSNTNAILQAFSKISGRIGSSQDRIAAIKVNLQSCKALLHCKRDELRKLWIEGIEHKTVAAMLDQIEQVKDVPVKLQAYIEKKYYLHATDLVVKSLALLEGDLREVEALRDIKTELLAKKEELHDLLIEELHKQVYVKSTSGVVKGFQRQGSARASRGRVSTATPLDMASTARHTSLMAVNLDEAARPRALVEDVHGDAEADPGHLLAVLVESMALLRRAPEAVDALRARIRPGLLAIVTRSTQQVADSAYFEVEEDETLAAGDQTQYLLDLLQLVTVQFKVVAHAHQVVLANLRRVKTSMALTLGDFVVYDVVEVWTKIQSVVQTFLGDYLDVRHTASAAGSSGGGGEFDKPSLDMSGYFMRKTSVKRKKLPLFRFEASSHAISMNSYLREQRQDLYGSEGDLLGGVGGMAHTTTKQYLCRPAATNITLIYNPLQSFIKEVEAASGLAPGTSTLHAFVAEFISNIFLGQVLYNMQSAIDAATKGFDAQRIRVDVRTQRALELTKPILQSTVTVYRKCGELRALMDQLPDYSDPFLAMICRVLAEYKDTCQDTYQAIIQPDLAEEKHIISATWAKDEDIHRFLRCLPNWTALTRGTEAPPLSEEDARALNCKESSILTSNLASTECLIPAQELITELGQLRTLANLAESLDWFAGRITHLAHSFPADRGTSLGELRQLASEFRLQGELCLLVLHLEVRVHCFHYLLPVARQASYASAIDDMDPDASVVRLNHDLHQLADIAAMSVTQDKFRYIFEGLGHLVASILINSTQYFRRVNENGVKKMCRNIFAVQQCLGGMMGPREVDLDLARQYYELLYLAGDDLMAAIREKGATFTEQEYANLVALAHRSERGAKEDDLQAKLDKLQHILQATVAADSHA